MKNTVIIISIIICILGISFYKKDLKPISGNQIKVLKVYDGDTILAEIKDEKYNSVNKFKIRLLGIDCFEGKDSEKAKRQAEKYNISIEKITEGGNIAREILEKELKNKTVYFDFKGIDKYSRALGILYTDSQNINQKMLNNDYCKPYEK